MFFLPVQNTGLNSLFVGKYKNNPFVGCLKIYPTNSAQTRDVTMFSLINGSTIVLSGFSAFSATFGGMLLLVKVPCLDTGSPSCLKM